MTDYSTPRTGPTTGRVRRKRRGRGLLVFLVVLIVLLVAADRIAVVLAQRQVASKVQSSQHLATKPSVTIEGFPFLTQVIANHYRAIRLSATGLTVGDSSDRIAISSLAARLSGVRATGNFSGVSAQTVDGTATIGYAELSRVAGVDLAYAGQSSDGNGRVQAKRSISALGKTLTGTVSAEVSVSQTQQLSFSAVKVSIADAGVTVPQSVADQFASVFKRQLSLQGLPFGLHVQKLVATAAGVSISAVAHDVNLG